MSEPDRALQGAEDIAACAEMWWRSRGRRGVRVSRRTVIRWIKQGLPAERVAGGPWVADADQVRAWLTANIVTSTGNVQDVQLGRSAQ